MFATTNKAINHFFILLLFIGLLVPLSAVHASTAALFEPTVQGKVDADQVKLIERTARKAMESYDLKILTGRSLAQGAGQKGRIQLDDVCKQEDDACYVSLLKRLEVKYLASLVIEQLGKRLAVDMRVLKNSKQSQDVQKNHHLEYFTIGSGMTLEQVTQRVVGKLFSQKRFSDYFHQR